MQKQYIIGIDIGTSGCKTILADNKGRVVASSMEEYPLYTPKPGWAEQDPEDWWKATISTISAVLKKSKIFPQDIKAIGLSGQMHGLIALDSGGNVIRPAFLWNDQRTLKQCSEIINKAGGEKQLLKYTNNSMLPGYTGGKILWLKQKEPQNYQKAAIFLNPKDYIRFKLTGVKATEVSDASGTGLFDVKNRRWSSRLLDILDIPQELLPQCYESPEITGYITKESSGLTGLLQGTAVAGGGGDAVIQTAGTGIINEGILGLTVGTAGIVAMGLESFKFNSTGKLQIFCNNAPNRWHIMGVTLAAGGSMQWFKNTLCRYEAAQAKSSGVDVYSIIDKEVMDNSTAGSKGLVFLPYMIGERCPYPDPNARGTFVGLTLRHSFADIARSIMEGVTFSLKQVYELVLGMDPNLEAREIRVSGGGSNSVLWKHIIADIFQLPVKTVSGSKEGGAYGAVLVAGTGCGIWPTIDDAAQCPQIETEVLPDTRYDKYYEKLYAIYKDLYPALKTSFDSISGLENN
ncbi:MAG: xylulokinase [Actinobacteria bacterium]|nr:xylulokinase [Actinomycetota bacterium]